MEKRLNFVVFIAGANNFVKTVFMKHNRFNSMIRLVVAMLALMLLLSLASCGGGEIETEGVTETETEALPAYKTVTGIAEMEEISTGAIDSDYAFLCEAGSLEAVAGLRATERMYPASMTKLMTFIVAYENAPDHSALIEITKDIKNQYADASRYGIDVGDFMSAEQMMYALLLVSDTDAALGLAYHVAGNEAAFVELMNRKAAELGLTNTHFANVTGLHDKDHYSTAVEMAIILDAALSIPLGRTILTTETYATYLKYYKNGVLTDYRMTFYNTTLRDRFADCDVSTTAPNGTRVLGGKTGYTVEADRCLATLAQAADGREYLLITGHASSGENSARDAVKLYNTYTGQ